MKILILLVIVAASSRAEFDTPARCLQDPADGTCGDYKERWFYSDASGECKNFKYSGCGGNENNFETPEECMRVCKGEGPLEPLGQIEEPERPIIDLASESDGTVGPRPITIMMPDPTLRNNIDVRHLPDILGPEMAERAEDTTQEEDEDKPQNEIRPRLNIMAKVRMIRARFIPLMQKLLPPRPRVWVPPKIEFRPHLPNGVPLPGPPPMGSRLSSPPNPFSSALLTHLHAMKSREMRQKMKRAFRPPSTPTVRRPMPVPPMDMRNRRHQQPYNGKQREMHSPMMNKQVQLHPEMYDNRHQAHMSPNNKFQLVQIFVDKKAGPSHQSLFTPHHHHEAPNHHHNIPPPFHPFPFPPVPFRRPFYRPPPMARSPPHFPRHQPLEKDDADVGYPDVEVEYPDEDQINRLATSTLPPSLGKSFRRFALGTNDGVEKLTVDGTTFYVYNAGDAVKEQEDYACMLPLEHGHCKSFDLKWYYNNKKDACEMFVYGACGGNANRFDSYDECRETCMSSDSPTDPEPITDDSTTVPPGHDANQWYQDSKQEEKIESKTPLAEEPETTKSELEQDGEAIEIEADSTEDNSQNEITEHAADNESATREILGLKSTSTEYILVLVVVVVVGVAIVILVIVSLAHICRKWRRADQKEKVLEAYRDVPQFVYACPSSRVSSAPPSEKDHKEQDLRA